VNPFLEETLKQNEINNVVPLSTGQLEFRGLGIAQFSPTKASEDTLIFSAGIHGNETAPIEILDQIIQDIVDGKLTPSVKTLFILGNSVAMKQGTRFVEHNLNRLFCGAFKEPRYAGSDEAKRAEELEQVVKEFVAGSNSGLVRHYDLHTAIRRSKKQRFAIYPFAPGRSLNQQELALLNAADVNTILLQQNLGTTFSSFTSREFDAQGFTVELGQVAGFGDNDLSKFTGIDHVLRQLLVGKSDLGHAEQVDQYQVAEEILNTGDHFQFHVPEDVWNFSDFEPGFCIWSDDQNRVVADDRERLIVFPNSKVPVGHRAGLLVEKINKS